MCNCGRVFLCKSCVFVCENVLLFGSVFLRVCENNINQIPSSLYGLIDKIDQHQPRTKENKYKNLNLIIPMEDAKA